MKSFFLSFFFLFQEARPLDKSRLARPGPGSPPPPPPNGRNPQQPFTRLAPSRGGRRRHSLARQVLVRAAGVHQLRQVLPHRCRHLHRPAAAAAVPLARRRPPPTIEPHRRQARGAAARRGHVAGSVRAGRARPRG